MEFIAIAVFVFVALAVAGFRALAVLEAHKAAKLEAAERRARALANATPYSGRAFGRWER